VTGTDTSAGRRPGLGGRAGRTGWGERAGRIGAGTGWYPVVPLRPAAYPRSPTAAVTAARSCRGRVRTSCRGPTAAATSP